MNTLKLKEIIENNKEILSDLYNRKIFIISDLIHGGIIQNQDILEQNASVFPEGSENIISTLINSGFLSDYSGPVLIDLSKAIGLYKNSNLSDKENTAILMSRVNFMGTDGIRGKVVLDSKENCLLNLVRNNAFTPELVETCVFSFSNMCFSKNILKTGDTVVFGDDGRDRATGGKLKEAVIRGFNRAGINVMDLAIVPTALVPFKILKNEPRAGAMLTASHNPSNQNGIKFFIDGKKLLPEDEMGDYTLSALMFHNTLLNITNKDFTNTASCISEKETIEEEAKELIRSVLPKNTSEILKDIFIVFDSANGAFTDIGKSVLEDLNINYSTSNPVPNGSNINKNCGVAEIEGHDIFEGKDFDAHIPFVKEVFNIGRKSEPGKVYGVALDGDGDRGFLLYYNKNRDCINVLDGDKCGFILGEYFIKEKQINPQDYYFVSTIESDLMLAASAEEVLKFNTNIVSVGDKWICNFKKGKVLVGVEISGHLIFPIEIKSDSGKTETLLSGVGLLTGLMSLIAIKKLNLSEARIEEPFNPGISKTFYVFFVDKSKFYKNSDVWQKDCEILEQEVKNCISLNTLPADTKVIIEGKEDPNVLYYNFVNNEGKQACIFMRNSGTEDKTAVYVQGKKELEPVLYKIGKTLQKNHSQMMKNPERLEYKCEQEIYSYLKDKNESTLSEICKYVQKKFDISDNDIHGVLYGLKKEGQLVIDNNIIKKK